MPKKGTTKANASAASAPRARKLTKKQTKAKDKKETLSHGKIPGVLALTGQVFSLMKKHWKLFGGILLIYLILNVVFASGVSDIGTAVNNIKVNLNSNGTNAHPLVAGISGFASLIASFGASGSATGTTLQAVLLVIESLVIIWALRHILAGHKITVKEAYYKSMAPLIPFVIVLFFLVVQFLPISFGSAALSAIGTSVGTVSGLWTLLSAIVFIALAVWSIYMLTGSLFAVYIVTLPDIQPRAATRSSRNLVKYRRLAIFGRLLFLPVVIAVLMGIIIIPLILYVTGLVVPIFFMLSVISLLFAHIYLYSLYRGLIG